MHKNKKIIILFITSQSERYDNKLTRRTAVHTWYK